VHAAVVLEQDAQHHRQTDKAAAQLELTSGLAALQHALALGAPAAAQADLKQAATKDEDALTLLDTVNTGKVRLDLATALNLKEKALVAMGVKPAGSVTTSLPPLPPEPPKPPPSTTRPPPLHTTEPPAQPATPQERTIDLVAEAITHENDAAQALDRGDTVAHAASLLDASVEDLEGAFKVVEQSKGFGAASLQIWYALDHDYEVFDILDGVSAGCADCEFEDGYDHKLRALEYLGLDVGHSTVHLALTSVFDAPHLSTDYTAVAISTEPGAKLRYEWSLRLTLVDPLDAPAPGIPSSGAAIDLSCTNSLVPGGTAALHPLQALALITGFVTPVTIVWTDQDATFTWFHGDVGSYPGSQYGCDHTKMGPERAPGRRRRHRERRRVAVHVVPRRQQPQPEAGARRRRTLLLPSLNG
jgi:hypothetical protein